MMEVIMLKIFLKKVRIIQIYQTLLNGIKYGLVKKYGIVILYQNNGCKFLVVITIIIKYINL